MHKVAESQGPPTCEQIPLVFSDPIGGRYLDRFAILASPYYKFGTSLSKRWTSAGTSGRRQAVSRCSRRCLHRGSTRKSAHCYTRGLKHRRRGPPFTINPVFWACSRPVNSGGNILTTSLCTSGRIVAYRGCTIAPARTPPRTLSLIFGFGLVLERRATHTSHYVESQC